MATIDLTLDMDSGLDDSKLQPGAKLFDSVDTVCTSLEKLLDVRCDDAEAFQLIARPIIDRLRHSLDVYDSEAC